ncbi:glycosyltransferase, partial [Proteus mirabilis]
LLSLISEKNLNNNIKILPPTKNINKIYKSASIYCMTSRFEGMPLVLLEALSFNLPLIAYDCNTGPSEIITSDENGLLIENTNTEHYISALSKLALNESYYNQVTSNILIKNYFSIDKIITEWVNNFD